jgi:hypothetical protein
MSRRNVGWADISFDENAHDFISSFKEDRCKRNIFLRRQDTRYFILSGVRYFGSFLDMTIKLQLEGITEINYSEYISVIREHKLNKLLNDN